jgi:4-hydroxy-tetrahydrodipicolinate synthase
MMQKEDIRGIIAFVPTAFTESGILDEDANRSNVQKMVNEGMHIIQACGGAGEFYSLTIPEHITMMRMVAEETTGRAGSICGCGTSMGTADAIERVRIARNCGIDAAMLVTPQYYAASPSEVIKFFQDIADAVGDIGLVHYNTAYAKIKLAGEHYRELAKIPTFLGAKHGARDLYEWFTIHDLSPEVVHFPVDDLWVPAMRFGVMVVDSLLAAVRPKCAMELWKLCEKGKWDEAWALQRKVWRLIRMTNGWEEAEEKYGDCSIDKGVVEAAGFLKVGNPRAPYAPVEDEFMAYWSERFKDFDAGKYDG